MELHSDVEALYVTVTSMKSVAGLRGDGNFRSESDIVRYSHPTMKKKNIDEENVDVLEMENTCEL